MEAAWEADYVIIGAGAAGCVLAARLAEDSKNSVILIEAGPDNSQDEYIQQAAKYLYLWGLPKGIGPSPSPSHWGFVTEPQEGKTYAYPRGTGLGGSTNHHAMVDGRGSATIYDRWAELTEDKQWCYESLTPYFKKIECYNIPQADAQSHNKSGWLHIRRPEREKGFHDDFIEMIQNEFNIPFRNDFYNDSRNFSGMGFVDLQIHEDGRRSNAAYDLLLPTLKANQAKGCNNLTILADKLVARVIFEHKRAWGVEVLDAPRAYSVDAAHSQSQMGKKLLVQAKKEVILCCGAINTPQLLLLSGLGPKEELKRWQIPLIQELPGVGQHLQDHVECVITFKIKNLPNKLWRLQALSLSTFNPEFSRYADPKAISENGVSLVLDWFSGYDDPDPRHPDLHISMMHFPFRDFNLDPEKFQDPDPLKGCSLNTLLEGLNPQDPQVFLSFLIEVIKVQSSGGSITLQSSDPTIPPCIDLKLNQSNEDLTRLALGMDLVRKMMASQRMQTYEPIETQPGLQYSSREQMIDYLKHYSAFGHHISGTAKMGSSHDPLAVVDSKLRVYGVEGLRICDGSVFPYLPAYNPSRATYVVAEVLADIMKQE